MLWKVGLLMSDKIIHVDFTKSKKCRKESFLSLLKRILKDIFVPPSPPPAPDLDSGKKVIYYNKGIS